MKWSSESKGKQLCVWQISHLHLFLTWTTCMFLHKQNAFQVHFVGSINLAISKAKMLCYDKV